MCDPLVRHLRNIFSDCNFADTLGIATGLQGISAGIVTRPIGQSHKKELGRQLEEEQRDEQRDEAQKRWTSLEFLSLIRV